jgi:3-hydroxyacyl-CoA dehydrogenase/enoyl-CoA hydratase/3-hydroxybutyryl-CoA epimerase
MTETIRWDKDSDGIVTLTLDDPDQRANTMNEAFQASFASTVQRLVGEKDSITGVIVTSGKDTFFAGGDLRLLSQINDDNVAQFRDGVEKMKADLRALETLGKPVVAALNGAALGCSALRMR